jgi:cobalt-zinc-cadmium efflux system protein
LQHHNAQVDRYNRLFAMGVGLNVLFVVVEVVFGFLANSLALLADAGHNLADVLSLLLAWGAHALSSSRPTHRRTYGFRRSTILASLISAVALYSALGAMAWEAINRFQDQASVSGSTVIVVAALGMLINGATALLFARDRHRDLNVRGAFVHMAADALVSLGVVLTGFGLVLTGWTWLDPAISLAIIMVVAVSGWSLVRESLNLALDAVPSHIDAREVRSYLESQPGVAGVHDLHIWAMSTTETALTVHLLVPDGFGNDDMLGRLARALHERFDIHHSTVQLEHGQPARRCPTACDHALLDEILP